MYVKYWSKIYINIGLDDLNYINVILKKRLV